jgi:hypothetical protein
MCTAPLKHKATSIVPEINEILGASKISDDAMSISPIGKNLTTGAPKLAYIDFCPEVIIGTQIIRFMARPLF